LSSPHSATFPPALRAAQDRAHSAITIICADRAAALARGEGLPIGKTHRSGGLGTSPSPGKNRE
jgi:hypothetical protein